MAVTIKDIASQAGVSHTTVSRALRNHPSLAPNTIDRIQQLAAEMGYVPNTVARDLKNNRSSVMGVIVRRIADPFLSEVLDGIESVLTGQGYSIFLAQSNRDKEKEVSIMRSMSEQRVAGVIICSTATDETTRQQLLRFGVPSVIVNSLRVQDMEFAVYNDDVYGLSQVVGHLAALGHQKIAYVGNTLAGREKVKRLIGFKKGMADLALNIEPGFLVEGPGGRAKDGAAAVSNLLALPILPTAIVCFNDVMAVGAINQLEQAGLAVPADVSVTGFDNIEISSFVSPPLTTFHQPKFELGQRAARMILNRIQKSQPADGDLSFTNTNPNPNHIITLQGRLIERGSTAPPSGKLVKSEK